MRDGHRPAIQPVSARRPSGCTAAAAPGRKAAAGSTGPVDLEFIEPTKWADVRSWPSALLYAIPLFKGSAVVGGLLLEAEPPLPPPKLAAAAAAPPSAAAPCCSLATLQQLGLAAAVGLSVEAEEVACLAAALLRVLAGPVRSRLAGPFAAEFEALRATTPGSFAVLRSQTASGLLQRPASASHAGMMAASAAGAAIGKSPLSGRLGSLLLHSLGGGGGGGGAGEGRRAGRSMEAAAGSGGGGDAGADAGGSAGGGGTSADLLVMANLSPPLTKGYSRGVSFSADTARSSPAAGAAGAAASAAARNLSAGSSFDDLVGCSLVETHSSGDAAFDTAAILAVSVGAAAAAGATGLSASVISITGVDAAASKRQAMDLLMRSLQATLGEDGTDRDATTNWEDLEEIELYDLLGKGGGGVVFRGRLGTQEVAVKVMELPDVDVLDSLTGAALGPSGAAGGRGAERDRLAAGGAAEAGLRAGLPLRPAAVALLAKEQLRARKALLRNATEMAVHGQISHPNLLQVYATYPNIVLAQRPRVDGAVVHCLLPADSSVLDPCQGAPTPTCCAIVMELADCGCLASALSSRAFPPPPLQLSPPQAPHPQSASSHGRQQQQQQRLLAQQTPGVDMRAVYLVLLDVALALRHLHANGLVHRDLKPANLLLRSSPRDPRGFTVKLADFGFVMRLSEAAEDGSRYCIADQACGTVTHMAPELLGAGAQEARVTAAADVYSFGILMWELLAGGSRPFPHLPPEQIPRLVAAGARPVFPEGAPLAYR
ncbi:hypothetical protein GPECTOR_74g670 [Gonium pectorale]|uniref:Protein kinase domain-containing protein n=1 Tax=Gonium pectorale TaxID=33097 RepID=A0A150G2F8_GONPE|nr:hypothetical protein GPECTOR_74g670 [Gonium pectorale]|eukprot:KXZ44056.1 hypothetical protein GPECTOR_74g670 [Gonium pectorale]